MAPVWSKQRRSCLTFTSIYGVGALCLLAVLAAVANLLSNQAIPNQCIEYRDASAVVAVDVPVTPPPPDRGAVADADDLRFDPRILDGFQLWRVAPYNAPKPESLGVADEDTLPVLFVHGHRGAPSQAFAMATIANVRTAAERGLAGAGDPTAAEAAGEQAAPPRAFTFYTADFHEGSSAFHSGVLLAQGWFINDAVRAIRALHPRARHVPVFAHSMGGISARLAYHLANHPRGAMDTLVTLNTPHQGHPYGVDAAVQRLFDGLHRRWSRPLVEAGWRPVRPRAVREAEAAAAARGGGAAAGSLTREWWRLRPGEAPLPLPGAADAPPDPLRGVVLVSVTGGAMDNLVRPDLSSLAGGAWMGGGRRRVPRVFTEGGSVFPLYTHALRPAACSHLAGPRLLGVDADDGRRVDPERARGHRQLRPGRGGPRRRALRAPPAPHGPGPWRGRGGRISSRGG